MANEVKIHLAVDGGTAVATVINAIVDALGRLGPSAAAAGQQTGAGMQKASEAITTLVPASNKAAEAIDQLVPAAQAAAQATSSGMSNAERAIDGLVPASARAADAIKRLKPASPLDAARDILNIRSFKDIQREIDLTAAAYNRLERSGKLSAGELKVAQDAAAASTTRLKNEMTAMAQGATVSAGQTAAAMRQLPAQFTDIATSLQGGQSPLTVLLQQGGQIKDSFGGVGAAAKALGGYVVGLVGPFTIAAAAGAALAVAYFQGAAEARAYQTALIMTGGAAGVTAGRLADMAKSVSATVGTQGKAAEVLTQLASASNINPAGLNQFAEAAIKMERATGAATAETVKKFSDLGKAPLAASLKLNEAENYLTTSVYEQIKALSEQGRTTDAAALAQKAYADATIERAGQVTAQLGGLERGWMGIKDMAAAAWDSMLGIGRAETLGDRIAAASKKVADLQQHLAKGGRKGWFGEKIEDGSADELASAQADLAGLQSTQGAADAAAKTKGDAAAMLKAKITWDEAGKQYISGLKKLNADVLAAQTEGQAAGASAAEIATRVAAIRYAYDLAAYDANASLKLARGKAAADAEFRQLDAAQSALDALRGMGLVGERSAAQQSLTIEQDRLAKQRALIQQQRDIEAARPVNPRDDNAATAKKAKLAELDAQLAAAQSKIDQAPVLSAAKVAGIDLADARADAAAYAQIWQSSADLTLQLSDQIARGLNELITDPLQRARADAEVAADAIIRNADKIALSLRNQIDILRGKGDTGMADELQKQLDKLQTSAPKAAEAARAKPDQEFLQGYLKPDINTDFSAGFDKSSAALGTFVQGFTGLVKMQSDYDKARQVAAGNADQLAAVEAKNAAQQLHAYGSLAGAAKGFFKEGTTGYKLMSGAEKAMRAVEMAGAAETAALKLGLIDQETVAKIAGLGAQAVAVITGQSVETGAVTTGEAARNTAKIPGVFMSFMSSLGPWGMAAAGVAIAAVLGGAFGGGGGKAAPTNTGTGTVLGDPTAKSESIAKSLDHLADVDKLTMRYSAQMAASLRNIEAGIGGLSSLLVRSGNLGSAATGVPTGFKQDLIGKSVNAVADVLTLGLLPGLGKALGGLFGSKTSISGSGIAAGPQTLGSIQTRGLDASYYADVETKKKTLGFTISTRNSTQMTDAGAETERQFSLILGGFADAVKAAAVPLGENLAAVESRVSGFVVDLGKIKLDGLTGTQISETLTAVFGAAGDNIARAALPGLDAFTAVGEGYLQTVVRVASGTEVAQAALKKLGVGAVSLAQIANKQGDVAAETVRQSLVAAESVMRRAGGNTLEYAANSIGQIIETLSGSAQDLADTYKSLTDVRLSLQLLGLKGDAVTTSLLQGAGSIEALTDGLAGYEDKFFTSAEKTAAASGRMTKEFGRLGLALPKSGAEFRSLVQGIDTSTSAGQELLGGVLNLSSGFADLLDSVQNTGSGIADEIKRLKGLNTGAAKSYAATQASFAIKTAQARAGDQEAIDALPAASQALLEAAERQATSSADLVRVQASTLASLEATLALVSDPTRKLAGIPGFASGGSFSGGLRIVGENGSELEATGASRIFNASQTRSILSGGGGNSDALLAELRSLRAEVAALRADQADQATAIAGGVSRTARILDRMTSPEGDALTVRATS